MKRLSIGISDFKELIENNYYFVDTTKMIADVCNEEAKIVLITRPRRFGKTLNMSMLRYFFDNTLSSAELFEGLDVSQDTEVMEVINSYPTIFITFKDMKNMKWEDTYDQLKFLIAKLYNDYSDVIEKVLKNDFERDYFNTVKNQRATPTNYKESLKNLTEYLFRVYNKPVMLIIDEYDVPIQSGWVNNYYDDIIDFMKSFLSGALKDNSYLFKGFLTGIYRVAKESIFSGLNNLLVYTVLDHKYSSYFGFTPSEVLLLLKQLDLQEETTVSKDLKLWYNGYNFGSTITYNPWSILCYLEQKLLKPYWINTSSNDLIINLIEENMKIDGDFRESIEDLISGKAITETIDDSTALRDLQTRPDSIWTLFLFSGYLKAESYTLKRGKYECELSIPNEEVRIFFQDTVLYWLEKSGRRILTSITKPLLKGDGEVFVEKLKKFILETLSYYDFKSEPENTYHMLLLGMFAHLTEDYWIKSNRESGLGRYDIILKAKDKNNFSAVIEIKSSVEKTADGMVQIEEKLYTTELESEGYTNILKVSLGVDGKNVEAFVCNYTEKE